MPPVDFTPLTFPQALALAMEGRLTQSALATALGYTQPAVSQWLKGTSTPKVEDYPRIEEACRRPRGFLLYAMGYIEGVTTVEQALTMDPKLTDLSRPVVLAAYHSVVDHHRLLAGGDADAADGDQP